MKIIISIQLCRNIRENITLYKTFYPYLFREFRFKSVVLIVSNNNQMVKYSNLGPNLRQLLFFTCFTFISVLSHVKVCPMFVPVLLQPSLMFVLSYMLSSCQRVVNLVYKIQIVQCTCDDSSKRSKEISYFVLIYMFSLQQIFLFRILSIKILNDMVHKHFNSNYFEIQS